ncbi:MAG: acyltransferase [Planctomycetaceae bacterium]
MKALIKQTLRILSGLAVSPAMLLFRLQAACVGRDRALAGWSQLFSLLPGTTGVYLRHAFYRNVLQKCDTDAWIGFGTILSHAGASVGRTAYIGNYCSIGNVTIEDDVLIASHVSVMNGCQQHRTDRLDIPIREQTGVFLHVTIGRDTWIGERATIAASVGRHCVIGAGAVVVSPIPDYSIAVGVPAKVIRDRRDDATTVEFPAARPTG